MPNLQPTIEPMPTIHVSNEKKLSTCNFATYILLDTWQIDFTLVHNNDEGGIV